METHRQECQNCRSKLMNNILVREPGRSTVIFARCAGCGDLVARYSLEEYYHHGKGVESYLRSAGGGAAESGRGLLHDFKEIQSQALTAYEEALEHLRTEGKEI